MNQEDVVESKLSNDVSFTPIPCCSNTKKGDSIARNLLPSQRIESNELTNLNSSEIFAQVSDVLLGRVGIQVGDGYCLTAGPILVDDFPGRGIHSLRYAHRTVGTALALVVHVVDDRDLSQQKTSLFTKLSLKRWASEEEQDQF